MGNKISIEKDKSESESEKRKDTITYKNAKRLKEQLVVDLREKRIGFIEFNENMDIIERFIQYYQFKYEK